MINSCCRGKAYKVIEPCGAKIESSEQVYKLARVRVKKQFVGVQHIVDAHLAQVADGSYIKQDDVTGIDQLLVSIESCCLTLKEFILKESNYDIDTSAVIQYNNNTSTRFYTFVANRLAQIHNGS